MNIKRSSTSPYNITVALVAVALCGFTYSVRSSADAAKPEAKAEKKSWGVLRRFAVGEKLEAAVAHLRGAESVRSIPFPGKLRQRSLMVRWERGDHLLNLVFVKDLLASGYELENFRDEQGKVVRRQWQAINKQMGLPEKGEL